MLKTAFLLFVPFVASIAACSSSGGTESNPDGGTTATSTLVNATCPAHCTRASSRDSACTTSSKVGERFGCTCDSQAALFFDTADCGDDYTANGSVENRSICCNPNQVRQPVGSACDTAEDCATVTCPSGGQGSGCGNGICLGAKDMCGH